MNVDYISITKTTDNNFKNNFYILFYTKFFHHITLLENINKDTLTTRKLSIKPLCTYTVISTIYQKDKLQLSYPTLHICSNSCGQ